MKEMIAQRADKNSGADTSWNSKKWNLDMGELKINQNGIETAHKYTWKNSAQMVLKYV